MVSTTYVTQEQVKRVAHRLTRNPTASLDVASPWVVAERVRTAVVEPLTAGEAES
jgi:hypothetical protein